MSVSDGKFWEIDGRGFIVNDASSDKISMRYQPAVTAVVDAYRTHLAGMLHSVYLRGSVPRGMDIPGISDLDTVGVSHVEPVSAGPNWSEAAEKMILERCTDLTGVQFELFSVLDVLNTERVYELPFMLKTQSLCIFGNDLALELPDYRPDIPSANIDICQIEADIGEAQAQISAAEANHQNVRYWCSRVMKNIIRTGFSLTMPCEKSSLVTFRCAPRRLLATFQIRQVI